MSSRSLAILVAVALFLGGLFVAVGHVAGELPSTWIVTRTQGNPHSDAVVVQYSPTSTGLWSVTVSNHGLSSINVSVFDGSGIYLLFFQKTGFGDRKPQIITTAPFLVSASSSYLLAFVPYGQRQTYAAVTQNFVADEPPVASFTYSPTSPIAGESVSFDASASSDPDGSIVSYSWDFGDGASGTGATASHTYAAAGTFTVTLTVTDNLGVSSSLSQMITVRPAVNLPPTASFTVTPASPIAGQPATFDGSASADPDGTIVSYSWDFGDGNTVTGASPLATHTYASAGTFTVVLTVTDDGGATGTASQSVTVVADQPPTASFTFSPASPTAGAPVTFNGAASSDPDGTIVAYSWDFGDTSPLESGVTPSHTFANAGTYTVTLTVTDNGGLTGSTSQSVTVGAADVPPTASFTFAPASPSVGQTVSFDGSASVDPDGNIANYAWTFGDGGSFSSITVATATHAYSAAGAYTVTLVVTDNAGLTASASKVVTVIDLPPIAAFTYTPPLPSSLQLITFDASGSSDPDGTITAYAWTFGDGGSSTGVGPTHSYSLPGTYTVTLTVTDNGGMTGSASQALVIADLPPTAAFTFSPASPVAGQTVTFDASGSSDLDGTITAYAWTFGDGGTGTGVGPTHVFATQGTYTVTLTVTDNGGLTATVSHSVTVGSAADIPPTASFTFTPASPSAGQTVTFDGSASADPDGTITAYAWTFGDGGSSTGVGPTHSYSLPGTYTVTLTVTDNGGMTGSVSHSVTVADVPPTASFTFSPASPVAASPVSFDGTGSSDPDGTIAAYAWTFGDGGTGTGSTLPHTYATAGTYTVTLTVTDNGGMTGSVSHNVVVSDAPPTVSFTYAPASPIATQTITFTGTASDPDGTIAAYAWTFGDGGVASTATTTHAYAHAGTYTVTLTVTDNGGMTGSSSQSVIVADAPPVASFTYAPASPVAASPVTFDGTGSSDPDGTIASYAWIFGDGASGTGSNPTHTYALPGAYTVTLTVTDDAGKTGSVSHSVTVSDAPPTASFTYAPASPIATQTITFSGTASDPDGTITAYAWTFGDGASGTGAVATHAYAHAGTYTVTLTVTDNGGMTGSSSQSVLVADAPPVASFTFSPPYPLFGTLVSFDGTGSSDPDGTIAAYAWTFGDGGTGTGSKLTHTFATAGTYTVTLTVTDNGGMTASTSQPITIVSDVPPTAVLSITRTLMSVSASGVGSHDPDGTVTGYAFAWGDGTSTTGPSATASHIYTTPGAYTITLTVTDNGGMTGTTTSQTSVGPSTLDYTYYDFFNVPWGEWWDLRTKANYGDEPIGASCFNQTSVNDGTCTTNVAGIPRVAQYPYEDWSGPGSATSIWAPYRVKVAGLNVGGYNLSQPVFLPALNYTASPGSQLSFTWNMQYLDVAGYTKYTSTLGCYAPSGANANDGYQLVSGVYLTLDNQEAARLFGSPATGTQAQIQAWWSNEVKPGCAMTTSGKTPQAGPLEVAVNNWFANEANGKYDIYNGYAGAYFSLFTNITATVASGGASGTTNVYLEHGAWGTEILLDRWFHWGNATYAGNQADSSRAAGWWGMENGWWEGVHYAGKLTASAMNFNLTGVLQYHFQERSAPGPDGVYRSSSNLGDSDDVPVWTWGPQLVDYVASTNSHPYSELDRYSGLNYMKTTPGSGDYGTNTSFDYTPISWVPKAGETWRFVFPSGTSAYYQNPATATLGTNLPGAQLPSISSTLTLWKTAPGSYGTWAPSASTWGVYGGASVPWPPGTPRGGYPYIPLPSIYFVPSGSTPGNAVVAGIGTAGTGSLGVPTGVAAEALSTPLVAASGGFSGSSGPFVAVTVAVRRFT